MTYTVWVYVSTDNGRQIGSAFNFVVTPINIGINRKRFDRMRRCWLGIICFPWKKDKWNSFDHLDFVIRYRSRRDVSKQQAAAMGYLIGRWIGSAFVLTSWRALLLWFSWFFGFISIGRSPAYLRWSHIISPPFSYWIIASIRNQIWDSCSPSDNIEIWPLLSPDKPFSSCRLRNRIGIFIYPRVRPSSSANCRGGRKPNRIKIWSLFDGPYSSNSAKVWCKPAQPCPALPKFLVCVCVSLSEREFERQMTLKFETKVAWMKNERIK